MIADGARAISDFRVLADQKEAFGQVASVPPAFRTLEDAGCGHRACWIAEAHVTELTGLLRTGPSGDQLAGWPAMMRLFARRERPAPAPTATPRSGDPAPSAGQPGPARAQLAPRAITPPDQAPPDQAPGKITASPYPPQTALIRARRTQITNPRPECLRTRIIIQNSPSI